MGYGTIGPPWWDEVWIVASGPSVRQFDLSRLRFKQVLAVNDALFQVPPSQQLAVATIDPDWTRRHRDFLAAHQGEKYCAVPLETWPDCYGIPGMTYLQQSHCDGLSDDPQFLCTGGNSGYAALNVAYLKRAKTIHLVGFDMDPSQDDKFRQWAPRFDTMLPQLRRRGVVVTNHNPRSFVDAFPRVA